MRGKPIIAIGASTSDGSRDPFVIQAQFLRAKPGLAKPGAQAGFLMPDDGETNQGQPPAGHWREDDLKRAIAAAEQAGLSAYRVEIAPDGTIAIVVGG